MATWINLNGMFRGCGDGLIVRSRLLSDRSATSWFPQGNWARRIIPRIIYRLGKPCNSPRIWWYKVFFRDTTLFFPIWDIHLLDLIVWNFIWRLIQNQEAMKTLTLFWPRGGSFSNHQIGLISFLQMSSQSPKNWCYFSLSKKSQREIMANHFFFLWFVIPGPGSVQDRWWFAHCGWIDECGFVGGKISTLVYTQCIWCYICFIWFHMFFFKIWF